NLSLIGTNLTTDSLRMPELEWDIIFPSCGTSNEGPAAGKPPLRRGGFPAAQDSTLVDRRRVFRQLQTGMREDIMIRWSRIVFALGGVLAGGGAKPRRATPGRSRPGLGGKPREGVGTDPARTAARRNRLGERHPPGQATGRGKQPACFSFHPRRTHQHRT